MAKRGVRTKTSKPRGSGNLPNGNPADSDQTASAPRWTFLTNHAHVLVLLSRNPDRVLREVAFEVGITERAVQRIIADLEQEGFIEREKLGRQNHYRVQPTQALRHPIEAHCTIGDVLEVVNKHKRESRTH